MILQFPEKKRKKEKPGVFVCLRCDSDVFFVRDTREIECANCSAVMSNLVAKYRDVN